MYVHIEVSADGSKNFIKGSSVVAGLQSHADAVATGPTYTFATPVLGGQAAFSVFAVPGDVGVGIDATLTGPRGRTISGTAHDERTTLSDVFYEGTLKWNNGVHNTMIYTTGNIPSGTYDANRLANLSLGFVALATPISMRRPEMNSQSLAGSPTTSTILTMITRMASTLISIGPRRTF